MTEDDLTRLERCVYEALGDLPTWWGEFAFQRGVVAVQVLALVECGYQPRPKAPAVSRALSALVRKGYAERVSRGYYRVSPGHPARG